MAYTRYVYTRTNWKNKSESMTTPVGKTNMNHIEDGIYNIAENLDVVYHELDAGKFDESNAGKVIVGMPTWDADTGILTFHFYDGTEFSVDFNIEKIPVSFSMDSAGVITMTTSDGTQWTANIGDAIPDYKFEDSDRIAFSKTKNADGSYTIKADIKKNSITGDYLEPDYLAKVTTQASNAATSAAQAADYADAAEYDARLAQSYSIGTGEMREGEATDCSKYYKEQSEKSASDAFDYAADASDSAVIAQVAAETATGKADLAQTSASNAGISEANANTYAANACESADSANESAETATNKATEASASAVTASEKADDAAASALQAESYARGGTGSRANEDVDNAMYYYQQSRAISESFSGALRPMGTVAFANLPSVSSAADGDMYNVSDEFTTTEDFKEGSGLTIPAGSNVYKTYDGKWDILAGSPVTGVKGSAESEYHRGNVNITPESIGVEAGANKTIVDSELSDKSTNPIQNKVVNAAIDELNNSLTDSDWIEVSSKFYARAKNGYVTLLFEYADYSNPGSFNNIPSEYIPSKSITFIVSNSDSGAICIFMVTTSGFVVRLDGTTSPATMCGSVTYPL